jgi:hypothetical protein
LILLPETISIKENQGTFIINSVKYDYIKDLKVDVHDMNGKLVCQLQWPDHVNEQIIDTSSWNRGLYLIRITNPYALIAAGKMVKN